MPTVPKYTQQVATQALPNVRVRAPQPGTGLQSIGEGLQDVGDSLGAAAAREQERLNTTRVMQAESALKDEYRAFETAQRERRGEDAIGITGDVEKWFEDAQKRHSEALENDQQRFLFGDTYTRLRGSALDSASRYESAQRATALEDAAASSIEGSINTAAASYNDADAVAAERDAILRRIDMQAGFNGWPPERVKAEKAATLTRLHASVIKAAVDADPTYAREYYAANKGEIAGTVRDELEDVLRTGSLRATAQRATDEIMAQGLTKTEALEKARSQYDGEERDEITRRIKTRYAENNASEAERERELADAAWDAFARGGNKVEAIPAAVLEQLDGRTLIALRKAEAGGPSKTDWSKYYDLRQLAMSDPAAFAQRDLRQDFGSLREPERRQLIALQEALRDPTNLPEAATTEKQIEVARNQLELTDKDDIGKLQSAVYSQIAAFTRETGREPTYDERQQIIDRLVIKGEIPGFFDDDETQLFKVVGTEDEAAFVPTEVPRIERDAIIRELEARGRPVTDEAILYWYRIALAGQ